MTTTDFELFHYWRSSCSWRVRYALALKGLNYKSTAVNLLKDEQSDLPYLQLNPAGLVPTLLVKGRPLTDSLAIVEWLEEAYPTPALLPKDPWARAQMRSFVMLISAGIQPLANLRTSKYHSADAEKKNEWNRHFITEGLIPVETLLRRESGSFSFGDTASMADVFLIPQVYNAHRFNVDMSRFPNAQRVYDAAMKTAACDAAAPHNQPGAS